MKFRWLKAYMPRSLMGRAALILALPIVMIQLVVGIVFIQRHYEYVSRQMTRNIFLDLSYLVQVIEEAPDTATARTAVAPIAEGLAIDTAIGAEGPRETAIRWFDLPGFVLEETLAEDFEAMRAVDVRSIRKRVALGVETRHGLVRFEFDRYRVAASNPHQLLVLMVFVSLVFTLISFLFLKNQIRPIRHLAVAATAFGRGRSVEYWPGGAAEVRDAGRAFLDMRNRIERHIEQRTLMLSGVSHDLRTPLTRLKLGLSMMPPDEEVDALRRDVEEMEQMIETFLAFAREDAVADPELTDPADLAAAAVEKARRGGGVVEFAPPERSVRVPLRPMAVSRALDNLIGNALRYGTRARVTLDFMDRAVRLSVEDDGPGIPVEARETALKPFARLDSARNQNLGTGVGLGLAIAHDVARQHGGILRLGESEALGGLRVDLVLAR